jgi:glycosyltransferase involved in cell wall biosynthesis
MEFKTKVWIITYNYGSVKAGPVIRFSRYGPHFEKKDCNVTFVTIDRGEPAEPDQKALFLPKTDSHTFLVEACKKALVEQPEVLVFLSANYKLIPHLRKLGLKGIKTIYINTMKLSFALNSKKRKRDPLKVFALKVLSLFLYRSFTYIVNSTKALEETFLKLGIPKNKLKIIYNGVDTNKFCTVSDVKKRQIRQNLNIPQNGFCFLFIGLMVQRKGVLELVEAWIKYKEKNKDDTALVLVGDEMEDIAENDNSWLIKWHQIKEIVKDKNNPYNIVYAPFVANVQDYYKAADAFVFLSYLEGMPNVLLESMSSGLPVICAKFDGLSNDYGDDNKEIILIEDRRPETLFNKFKTLSENKTFVGEIGFNARKHALNNFSLEVSIQSYINLFRS